ncbi:MAG TPA: hypothetical protein PLR45_06430 [Flavobacteriales bacterium]|nr:hypothetical protein [Flavobacteriales bacterium]
MKRKCKHCKESFLIKRINQFYCSQSCRQQAYLIRNGFSKEKTENQNPNSEDLLKNVAGSVNPELLQGIISVLGGNASMTDLFTKTQEKPTNDKGTQAEPNEKSVNDTKKKKGGVMMEFYRKNMIGKRKSNEKSVVVEENSAIMQQKSGFMEKKNVIMREKTAIMENSCRKNVHSMGVSCEKHGSSMEVSCDSHASSMKNSCGKISGVSEKPHENHPNYNGKDIFSFMLKHQLTIPIVNNGYVRTLFPHWNDKEWKLSLHVNETLVDAMDILYRASIRNRIKTKLLHSCREKLNVISTGVNSIFLPGDYPFMKFARHLKSKVTEVIEKLPGDKEEIKFKLSDELKDQIAILNIQLKQ